MSNHPNNQDEDAAGLGATPTILYGTPDRSDHGDYRVSARITIQGTTYTAYGEGEKEQSRAEARRNLIGYLELTASSLLIQATTNGAGDLIQAAQDIETRGGGIYVTDVDEGITPNHNQSIIRKANMDVILNVLEAIGTHELTKYAAIMNVAEILQDQVRAEVQSED